MRRSRLSSRLILIGAGIAFFGAVLSPVVPVPPASADGFGACGDGFSTLGSCKYESHKIVTTCFNNCQRVDLVVKWRGGTGNSGSCNTASGIDSWHMHVIEVVRVSDGAVKWSGGTSLHTNGCPTTFSSPTLSLFNDHKVRLRWHHHDNDNSSFSFLTPSSGAHEMYVAVRI